MCHIIGIEPQFENIISNGPFIPMAAGQKKPEAQWTADERKAANLDQRLKSLIMTFLVSPDVEEDTIKQSYSLAVAKATDKLNVTNVEERVTLQEDYCKEGARNGEWVKISMRKVHTLLETEENDDRKHVNTKILKENKNLGTELKELKAFTETWLNSSNKVNQCINEQILYQKKRIMGVDPLTEDPSSSGQKDLVYGNKNSSASVVHSAPAGKIKSVKIEDDPPLAIVMKELNNLKLQVSKNQSSYSKIHSYHNDHYDIEWSKRCEALQDQKETALKSTRAESLNANRSKTPTKSQLYDAKYIIQFDEKRGTFFNSNKEVVMIAPIVRDVYVLNMTSSIQESCFFAKASENLNWLWHKRLAHLNFKTINKPAKQNLVIGLPSLVYSKDKPCSSCEKGKHHRTSFKTK
ncbi:retrovirus-related pol polyprotein from transposon TNT 1-94 [Tanacetum coccineum]